MMMYDFYVTTYQSGGGGKGGTQTDAKTDKHMNLIGHTIIPTGIDTTHLIVLVFSRRRIQSEF